MMSLSLDQRERFNVIGVLGEGATGRVFEVYDRLHGARCALKQLRTDRQLDARRVAAFKDEFRCLARLAHPNLVKVYELLVHGTDLCVLMELIDGVDFVRHVRCDDVDAQVIATQSEQDSAAIPARGGSLSEDRLRASLAQFASGVLALHAAGHVHCDLKPDNVLVDRAGRVVIVDFGLLSVRSVAGGQRPRGTPHYMAPEQMEGWASEASDWYAFGVVLYLALTGRLPFGGPAGTVDYEKRFGKPVDPLQLVPSLPRDLCQLAVALLSAEPRRRPSGDTIANTLGLSQPRALLQSTVPHPFVGRATQLGALEGALARANLRDTCVAFVHGDSGIGKTRLIGHFLDQVRSRDPNAWVLQSACYEDASVPYKGLDAIMDRIASELPRQVSVLQQPEREALATMFPVFGRAVGGLPAACAPHPLELRMRGDAAVRALFARLAASATVVLSIDDFQWTDDETLELLAEIVRPPAPGPLLLILGHRTQSPPTEGRMQQARAMLRCDYDVELGPLERDEVQRMVAALLDRRLDPTELDQIARECAGNPLLVRQLVFGRAAAAGDRTSLDRVLAQRIAVLGVTQRTFLELVALAGCPLDEWIVAKILRVSGEQVLTARHDLTVECFIRRAHTRAGAVEPYHAEIRQRVLELLPSDRARRHHAKLAAALDAQPGVDPETLALHYRGAGDFVKAALFTERAADVAAQALAFERAASLYEAAAAASRAEQALRLRVKQAAALSNAGRSLDAAGIFLDVSRQRPHDIDLRLRAGDELLRGGQLDRGLELLRTITRDMCDEVPRSHLLTQWAVLCNGWRLLRVRVAPAALARTPTPAQARQLELYLAVARRLAMVDPLIGSLFQRRYLRLALRVGTKVDIARGLAQEASFCAHMPRVAAGGPARAARLNALCRELVGAAGPPDARATADFADGMIAYAMGRFRDCRLKFERAVDILQREAAVSSRWDLALCYSFIGFMLWMEGDVPAIRERLPQYMLSVVGDLSLETAMTARVACMLALCDDDPVAARRLSCDMIARWPAGPWRLQHHLDATAQVEIDLYEGRTSQAWARATQCWCKSAAAGIFQQRFFIPFARLQRARIALAAGWQGRAEREIRALERWRDAWARALGRALRAALWAAQGKRRKPRSTLSIATRELGVWHLELYAVAARWRLGGLAQEPELTRDARERMEALGVRNPARMVDMLLPWQKAPASAVVHRA